MATNPKAHQASQHTAKSNPTQTAGGHRAVAQKTSTPAHSTAERKASEESASMEYAYRIVVELNQSFLAAIGDFTTRIESKFDAHRAEVKADIAEVRTEVKADIAEVRTEVREARKDIGDVRQAIERMQNYMMGAIISLTVIMITLYIAN